MTALLEVVRGGTAPAAPAPALPCYWCAEDLADGVAAYEPDPPTVLYDGKASCAWHATFYFGSKPASAFLAMGVDCG